MINLKDLLQGGKPGEGVPAKVAKHVEVVEENGADSVSLDGSGLVPDFVKPSEYIAEVEEKDAERVYEPNHEAPVQQPIPASIQPAYNRQDTYTEPAYVESEEAEEEEAELPMGVSLISKEATVLGDIITEGHIDVIGKVRGNVEAQGNIAIRGLVSGDLSGEKIGLYKCKVKGNLRAGTGVVVDSDSVVIGDVDTDNIVLGGKLKGDINAVRMAVLRSDAYFLGDVQTESLAIESGAVVNGNIRTIVQGDIEAPFDD